jgi:hypothetical protein
MRNRTVRRWIVATTAALTALTLGSGVEPVREVIHPAAEVLVPTQALGVTTQAVTAPVQAATQSLPATPAIKVPLPVVGDVSVPAFNPAPIHISCADVIILGLRGKGDSINENHGMGADTEVVANKMKAILAPTFTAELRGVPYDDNRAFDGGGEQQLRDEVRFWHGLCPRASLAVVGQSAGAAVAHQAVHAIIPPVSAVVLMGDPQHHPNAPYNRGPGPNDGVGLNPGGPAHDIPPGDYDRVASYCLAGDAVCGNGFGAIGAINNEAHQQYRNDRDGVATKAARFAATWVERDRSE